MSASLEDLLACPVCGAAIHTRDGTAACRGCGRKYPVIEGVHVFVPPGGHGHGEFYETADPVRYGRNAEGMGDQFAQPVRRLLTRLPQTAVVVELGSGRGAFDAAHPGYIATDFSFWALREFSTGARVSCDASTLPFRTGSIDAFFSIATLEHVPEPERVLAEIDRCLKPGGEALLYPAWYVRPWAARGLAIRPFRGLSWADRVRKAAIPLRDRRPYQFIKVLPGRLAREARLARGLRLSLDRRRLEPNLSKFVISDSDAYSSLDPHAVSTYFVSREYVDLGRRRWVDRVLYAYEPVLMRKGSTRRFMLD